MSPAEVPNMIDVQLVPAEAEIPELSRDIQSMVRKVFVEGYDDLDE